MTQNEQQKVQHTLSIIAAKEGCKIAELAEIDNAMLREIFTDLESSDLETHLTGYTDDEIQSIFADLEEPNLDELDSDADVEDTVSVKITFDTYKEYAKVEKEVKEFVEDIGARMVVTR